MSTSVLVHLSNLCVSFNIMEAAVNSLKITPNNFDTLVASKVSTLFFGINFALVGLGVLNCVDLLHRKFQFIRVLNGNGIFILYIVNFLSIGALSAILVNFINVYIANKIKKQVFAGDICDINVEFKTPNHQVAQQALLAARIAITIFLIPFRAMNPFIITLSLTSLGFSLYKVSNRKWMTISQEFYNPAIPGSIDNILWVQLINKIKTDFFFPLLEVDKNRNDECSICLEGKTEDESKLYTYFCKNHIFHIKCLPGLFTAKSENLLNGIQIISYSQVIKNFHRERANIKARIPLDNLPTCPNCRQEPVGQELYFWISENKGYTIEGYPTGGTHGTGKVDLQK